MHSYLYRWLHVFGRLNAEVKAPIK